jgi:hypothetical protein
MKLSPHVIIAVAMQCIKTIVDNDSYAGKLAGSSSILRECVTGETIFLRPGPCMLRKCYRMTETKKRKTEVYFRLHVKIYTLCRSHYVCSCQ